MDAGPIVNNFGAIEVLNEFYEANGWDADYRQIGVGILRSQATVREIGHIGLFREEISHSISGSARSPDDFFSIVISMAEDQVCISGHRLSRNKLLFVPPKSDLDISAIGGSDAVTINISASMLGDHLRAICDDDSLVEAEQISSFRIEQNSIEPIRRTIDGVASQTLRLDGLAAIESRLATDISRLLAAPLENIKIGDPYRRLAKHRIVTHAKEYIHENSEDFIRVSDLCEYCGVSLSTLERIFTRKLGINPNGYIQISRLHEVRRKLLNGYPEDVTFAEIAMSCGFMHMGRFSQRYRSHFGRLPSEDRLAANSG